VVKDASAYDYQAKALRQWRLWVSPPSWRHHKWPLFISIGAGSRMGHAHWRLQYGSVARCCTVVPCDFTIGEPRPLCLTDRLGHPATMHSCSQWCHMIPFVPVGLPWKLDRRRLNHAHYECFKKIKLYKVWLWLKPKREIDKNRVVIIFCRIVKKVVIFCCRLLTGTKDQVNALLSCAYISGNVIDATELMK
jgi:hypothetical protein